MSECQWIPVVTDVYSTSNYHPNQSESFEHNFTIDYEEGRPIKFIRIDIQDRFYLKEFKLIYLDTDETINGVEIGDEFSFRLICPPIRGKYRIVTQGGKYRYSIFLLESTSKLTREPICQALSPFVMQVNWPIKDNALHKHVSYRKVGTTDWETAAPSLRKVRIMVVPTSAYEIKLKLSVADLYETEYSPTIITIAHQEYADQFEPDLDFLQVTLIFATKPQKCLENTAITLSYKPTGSDSWINDTKPPLQFERKYEEPLVWDIGRKLYDILAENSMTVDWKLVFKNTKTDQVTESGVKTLDLNKRNKIVLGESLKEHHIVFIDSITSQLYLCRDGQFWYHEDDSINFQGNFLLRRNNPTDNKCTITLIAKFKKLNSPNVTIDPLSLTLLPELVKIILGYVYSPPYIQYGKFNQIVSLNSVCKNWFNILSDVGLILTGELSDDYNIGGYRPDFEPLIFSDWRNFQKKRVRVPFVN